MQKYIYIEADTNDADYIGSLNPISDKELETIKPLLKEILAKDNYNYDTNCWSDNSSPKEMYPNFSEEAHHLLEGFVPYGEYGVHSITNVILLEGNCLDL